MTNYFLSLAAELDIDEIISFLAEENPSAAYTFLEEVYEAMNTLADNPGMGYKREYIKNKNIRFWPFKWHYLIIYADNSPIEIIRVLSGYRDIPNLLN